MVCWSFASKIYSLKGLRTLPLDKIKSVVPGKRTEGFQVHPITHNYTPLITSHQMLPDWASPLFQLLSPRNCPLCFVWLPDPPVFLCLVCVFTRASMR